MSIHGSTEGASARIDEKIRRLADWRGKTLARLRAIIRKADPAIVEEWRWMGTPVWSRVGSICTGETYLDLVRMTFSQGARLKDPARLFNSGLDGALRRAIDIRLGERIPVAALIALVREAVALNLAEGRSATAPRP